MTDKQSREAWLSGQPIPIHPSWNRPPVKPVVLFKNPEDGFDVIDDE